MAKKSLDTHLGDLEDMSKDELLQHIAYFKKANEIAEVGYWSLCLVEDKLYWSEQIYHIHGVTKDEYKPVVESALNFYHPEDRKFVSNCVKDSIETGNPYEFKSRIVRPNGQIRYVEATGECGLNDKGEVIELFGTFHDITDIFLSEAKLKESEQRFSLAIEAGRIGIWDWDLQTDRTYWAGGSLRLLGLGDDVIERDKYVNLIHPEDLMRVLTSTDSLVDSKKPYDISYRIKHADGKYIWLNEKGQAIAWDAQDNVIRVVGSAEDITDRKEVEIDLMRSNKDLERFAFVASHDLREPMRTVTNFTNLLEEDCAEQLDEDAQKFIHFISDAASRMTNMINDLLSYSRVVQDQNADEIFNVKDMAEDVAKTLHVLFKENDVDLKIDENASVDILANKNLFSQLLQNLFTNAVKYKHKDRKPIIEVFRDDKAHGACFVVKDNGIGIEKEHFDKIFDLFFRLDKKASKEDHSTGMGLATCKRIVSSWNGSIDVESEFGAGSVFSFTIPSDRLK